MDHLIFLLRGKLQFYESLWPSPFCFILAKLLFIICRVFSFALSV